MVRNINYRSRTSEYTRSYSDLAGVELGGSGSNIAKNRLAYAENVYRDYEGDGSGLIESVPGYRRLAEFGEKIHALYEQKGAQGEDYLLIHAGTSLFRMKVSECDAYTPTEPIATLSDRAGCAFSHGANVYIVDGGRAVKIGADGVASTLGEGCEAYIPTLYLNGEIYEQRNLLTDRFTEEYLIEDPSHYTYGTEGIRYRIIDPELGTCAVSGMDQLVGGAVYIPSSVMLNGKRFKVVEVSKRAFSLCTLITELYIAEGVEKICDYAFKFNNHLKKVVIPRSVTEIGTAAFTDCHELTDVYLGSGVASIGSGIFSLCTVLKTVNYAGSKDNFDNISGVDALSELQIVYNSEQRRAAMLLPVKTDALSIESVSENGTEKEFTLIEKDGKITGVLLISDTAWDVGCDAVISGVATPYLATFGTGGSNEANGKEAVLGCRVAEVFDSRVFLAGNPSLPNTVFYSALDKSGEQNPLYFGALNYFNDGVGGYAVTDMLAVRDSLAVFKAGDDGSGSIFYHTPMTTGEDYIPKVYPAEYVHSGIKVKGGAISFFDDPLFVSENGIYALTQKAINYERSVACRSHNVNYDLLKEDLSSATLTEWMGYLAVGVRGRIYLADSRATFTHRTGDTEYEWFIVKDVGSWQNSTRVYRYDSYSYDKYKSHPTPGEICTSLVYSVESDAGQIYYTEEGGSFYTVYPTEEFRGGDFSPAVTYLGCDKHLFFGTESGVLLTFNNDKRGIAPDFLSQMSDFDPEEYAASMGRSIHPYFYSFDNHAPRYAIKTAYDNCDIPHLTKSTVKHSLVIKCKSYSASEIICEVGTEKTGYSEVTNFPGSDLSFAELNFESLSITTGEHHTLPVAEKEKGWVEKQITIYSDRFASPIGIWSLTYRYTVKGKIRKS